MGLFNRWRKPTPKPEVEPIPPEVIQAMKDVPDDLKRVFSNKFLFLIDRPDLYLTLGVYGGLNFMKLLDRHGYEIRKKDNVTQS